MKLFALILLLPAILHEAEGKFDPARFKAVDHFLAEFAQQSHIPCFVVGISVPGEPDFVRTYGPGADLENDVPCTEKTMLRVASVSKGVGSGLLAQMVEKGKLSWEDTVHKYVSTNWFPQKTWNGKPVNITLRQLVSHESGIHTSEDPDYLHDWELLIHNSTGFLPVFAKDPLLFEPGTHWYYSNYGWIVIAAMVEAVENRPYYEVIHDYMRPLGLKDTLMDTRNQLIPHRAQQYFMEGNNPKVRPQNIFDQLRPYPNWSAGGLISNVRDILTFGKRMLSAWNGEKGAFLKQKTVQELWTYGQHVPAFSENPWHDHETMQLFNKNYTNITLHYEMGWFRFEFPPESVHHDPILSDLIYISCPGELESTDSRVVVFPQHNITMTIIANRDDLFDEFTRKPVEVLSLLKRPIN